MRSSMFFLLIFTSWLPSLFGQGFGYDFRRPDFDRFRTRVEFRNIPIAPVRRVVLQSEGGATDWTYRIEIEYREFPSHGTLEFRKSFPNQSSVLVSDRLNSDEIREISRAVEGTRLDGPWRFRALSPDEDLPNLRLMSHHSILEVLQQRGDQHPLVPGQLSGCIRKIQNLAHRVEQRNDPFAALCRRSSHRDTNKDGDEELVHVTAMDFRPIPNLDARLVLVLVDPRLVQDIPGRPELGLSPVLRRYTDDLLRAGYWPRLVLTRMYDGPRHQDGRSLLALRNFFRTVQHTYHNFEGAVLVGSFPEALLVRSYNWSRDGQVEIDGVEYEDAQFMRSVPGVIADRSDIVLSDLDGNWGERYVEDSTELPSFEGVWNYAGRARSGWYRFFQFDTEIFEDFFHINDGGWEVQRSWRNWRYIRFAGESNEECTADDLAQPNPFARPEIKISRIDARHVALSPRTGIRGVQGEGLLDGRGRPQRIRRAAEGDVNIFWGWDNDSVLERQLLIKFFDRNHRYREGDFHRTFRPAAVGYDFGANMNAVRRAHRNWGGFGMDGYDIGKTDGSRGASVLEYVQWLKRPAAFRTVRAHTSHLGTTFGPTDAASLQREVGTSWNWEWDGRDLVPSWNRIAETGDAKFALYRSLWSNNTLPDQASFYFHTGCQTISPARSTIRPYSHREYGYMNGGESLLFYGKGLALIGRAKVFNDEPREFFDQLRMDRSFGESGARYSVVDSGDDSLAGIKRKRSYYWSVLGDWTLKLRPFGN